jgi:arylsulfatase A-like enzyme
VASKSLVMPRRFEKEGYQVFAAGKLFHNAKGINESHIPNYAGQFGGFGPIPKDKISGFPGMRLWDWGVYPERDDQMPDYQIASWAEERLAETQEQPFWMGVGFYRPHVPQFAPQKWFDMYPLESVQLPKVISDDLSDISSYGVDISRLKHISPTYEWVNENEEWKALVQSYLACVSFVDAQIGRVIEALDEGAYGDNTYVVLFSDHGFHLGEKERFAKRSLWEDGTRVPLMIVGPNIPEGKVCTKPVQLLDIYPTLLELTNLEADPRHEGRSLVPLLEDVEADWPHMARSNFGPGNYTILSERYRFIQYNDGSEEFYDHSKDPQEWRNVIDQAEYETIIEEHRAEIPQERYEILGQDSWGHKSYSATEENANARESESTGAAAQKHRNTLPVTPPLKSAPIQSDQDAQKPNVIMILIDDMGWADSAPYGSVYYDTPNLARLCGEGMRFTDAYAAAPLCSRAESEGFAAESQGILRPRAEPKSSAVGSFHVGRGAQGGELPHSTYRQMAFESFWRALYRRRHEVSRGKSRF